MNDLNNLFSLKGKNILVTGATGHLGKKISEGLASYGGNILVNSRSHTDCENLVSILRDQNFKAENASFDITSDKEINSFFKRIKGKPIHSIVNNAYSGNLGTIKTSHIESYINSYNLCVLSSHKLIMESLGNLRSAVTESGYASVVNIASIYGCVSPDLRIYESEEKSNPPFYGVAKAALIQWTKYAACEFGGEGIRVNSISPGAFPSKKVNKKLIKELEYRIPLGRVGSSEEIIGPIIFLTSISSSYVNGANLVVDGGWLSW